MLAQSPHPAQPATGEIPRLSQHSGDLPDTPHNPATPAGIGAAHEITHTPDAAPTPPALPSEPDDARHATQPDASRHAEAGHARQPADAESSETSGAPGGQTEPRARVVGVGGKLRMGGRKRTRALLLAAGVPIRPGQPVRCAAAEVMAADPATAWADRLEVQARERGEDGAPTTGAICAALLLSCGSQEGAARLVGLDDAAMCRRIQADGACRAARAAGLREGKRLFERSLYAGLRAGDTGALALWARYYGHRVGVVAEGATVGAGVGSWGGTVGGMGGAGGNGWPGDGVDLGREVRGALDLTDAELAELVRGGVGGVGGVGGDVPGSGGPGAGAAGVGPGSSAALGLAAALGGAAGAVAAALEDRGRGAGGVGDVAGGGAAPGVGGAVAGGKDGAA